MKKFFCLVFLFITFATGCSLNTFIRSEKGLGTPFAVGKIVNDYHTGIRSNGEPKSGLPMDGYYGSIKFGLQEDLTENWRFSAAAGPVVWTPTKGPDGRYFGADLSLRASYLGLVHIHPYVEGIIGVGRLEHRWLGEATKFQFSSGGGFGLSIPFTLRGDNYQFYLGYRVYHISNGSAIFGSPRPNKGYNTDLFVFGFQHDF